PRGFWREDAAANPPRATLTRPDRRALGTGILTGQVVAIDVDVLDLRVVDEILILIEGMLGTTPLIRSGRAPKTMLIYQAKESFAKIETPEMFFPDGSIAQVEVLAEGQQFVAFGIHPATRSPYTWQGDGTPETVKLMDLPLVTEAQAREIVERAEEIL